LPRESWLAEANDRFAALATWRASHPTATWTEIEAAVDAQLGPLRARVVGETAMSSDAATLAGERPACPTCGGRVQAAGARQRRLRGEQDVPLVVERTYARCPACGTGFFPPG
jgi:hypothetical protein